MTRPKFSMKLRLVCHSIVGISDQCVENSAISTDNSDDSDIFHNSDHDPFDAESEKDDQHKDKQFE